MSTIAEPIAEPTAPQFPGELRMVPVEDLYESPRNPRKYFAEGPLAELTESIRVSGVRAPLIVRPRLEDPGFEVGAGHRRARAAKRAGVTHVPALVCDLSDAEFLKVLTFDNAQREDVHPLEEAAGYRTYIDEALADVAAVAAEVGKSASYVYGRLKLLDLTPDSQKAFWDGKIKAGHAEKIARLTPRDQELAIMACEPPEWNPGAAPMSVRDLQEWITKNLHLDLRRAPFSPDAELLTAAGACGSCPHRLGNAPDFEAGVDLPDMCTRRDCYDGKVSAHIEAVKADRGADLVLISDNNGAKDPNVIPRRDWTEVQSATAGKEALLLDGARAGFTIRVIVQERIPAAPPAPKPAAPPAATQEASAPAPSKEEKQRLKREQAERERIADEEHEAEMARIRADNELREKQRSAEAATRLEIAEAILAAVKWPPKRETLIALLPSDGLSELAEALDPIIEKRFGGAQFVIQENLTPDDLAREAVLFEISRDFEEYTLSHGCETLHAAAKRYGVDVEAIRNKGKEAEGGTRKAVVKNLPALGGAKAPAKKAAKPAPAKKAAAPAKKSAAVKKAPAKKSAGKKGGKK